MEIWHESCVIGKIFVFSSFSWKIFWTGFELIFFLNQDGLTRVYFISYSFRLFILADVLLLQRENIVEFQQEWKFGMNLVFLARI